MKPRLSIVTLGVKNLNDSILFYKNGLGWKDEASESDDIAFFQLNSVVLALYPIEKLAEDAMVSSTGSGFSGITFAHNVSSESEVEKVLELAKSSGGKIVKSAQKVFWGGYSGYFSDPDGYLWEVAFNPFWKIDDVGNSVMK